MPNDKLTGNIRYRIGKERGIFGKTVVVLQVEVTYGDGPGDSYGMPKWLAGTGWRDAEVTDLQFISGEKE